MKRPSRQATANRLAPVRAALARLHARWAPHWAALAPREKLGVQLALVALGVLLVWWVGVAPALRTLRTTPAVQAGLDAQLERMRNLAAEAQALRQQPPLPPAQADAALRAATERLGNKARLTPGPDRSTVTLTGLEGGLLLGWLADVRSAAHARVVEAQLTREGNGFSGTVVLAPAGSAP